MPQTIKPFSFQLGCHPLVHVSAIKATWAQWPFCGLGLWLVDSSHYVPCTESSLLQATQMFPSFQRALRDMVLSLFVGHSQKSLGYFGGTLESNGHKVQNTCLNTAGTSRPSLVYHCSLGEMAIDGHSRCWHRWHQPETKTAKADFTQSVTKPCLPHFVLTFLS